LGLTSRGCGREPDASVSRLDALTWAVHLCHSLDVRWFVSTVGISNRRPNLSIARQGALMMSVPDRIAVAESVALPADWLIRALVPAVLAEVDLHQEAAEVELLTEFTPAIFEWPGLLDRTDRVLLASYATVSELLVTGQRVRPWELRDSEYELLRCGIGGEAIDMADTARIALLPYLLGQHAYRLLARCTQLLYVRCGPADAPMVRLRDTALTLLWELRSQLGQVRGDQRLSGRTARPLPVWVPQPRLSA